MGRLDGRVAIVTGAAQGIGATYAVALADEGADVVVSDILDTAPVVARINDAGKGRAAGMKVDVSQRGDVAGMVTEAISKFGRVDILVNNAAIFASLSLKPFMEIPDEEWEQVLKVNVSGLFNCARAVVPQMRQQKYGKIINISSGTVFNGAAMMLHYVTSKSAVIGFTRSLAREVGADGICVNALAPGFTLSEGVDANESYAQPVREAVKMQRCLQRSQEPEDLTGTLVFLSSADSDFMTGQTVLVDGGMYTH